MSHDRIAPNGGYDFPNKEKYRQDVWRCFAENVNDVDTAKVGFLPSKEGLEIPVALSFGFREENLYAIDKNAALLATAPWRKTYPNVNIYGSELARAGERMVKDGVFLDAVNLDLCGNLSVPMVSAITGLMGSGVVCDSGIVFSITALKGRETKEMSLILGLLADLSGGVELSSMSRPCVMASVALSSGFGAELLIDKEYKSASGVVMQYSVFGALNSTGIKLKELDKKERLKAAVMPLCDEVVRLGNIVDFIDKKISQHYCELHLLSDWNTDHPYNDDNINLVLSFLEHDEGWEELERRKDKFMGSWVNDTWMCNIGFEKRSVGLGRGGIKYSYFYGGHHISMDVRERMAKYLAYVLDHIQSIIIDILEMVTDPLGISAKDITYKKVNVDDFRAMSNAVNYYPCERLRHDRYVNSFGASPTIDFSLFQRVRNMNLKYIPMIVTRSNAKARHTELPRWVYRE